MSQNNRKKIRPLTLILILVAAIAISALLYVYLLSPMMDKRHTLEEKVAKQRTELQSLQIEKDTLTKPASEKPSDNLSVTEMSNQVPDGISLDRLVDDLQAAESTSSTQITDFIFNAYDAQSKITDATQVVTALTEAEEKSNYAANSLPTANIPKGSLPDYTKMVTVQLSVNGYAEEDIRNFINQLEEAQRTYVVEKVKFEAPDAIDATENDIVSATLQVTAFYYELPVEATKAPAKDKKKAEQTTDKK